MKQGIHPERHEVEASCTCGFSFKTHSTRPELRATICSHCHPFFTGDHKFVDVAGRIEKFERRYQKNQQTQPAAQQAQPQPTQKKKSTKKK